ncbi:hypothetical protein SNEBB_000641 [Seison nebaliae]|nr:hypothetical protein SNEBB_000641 [Seison nebaliae]
MNRTISQLLFLILIFTSLQTTPIKKNYPTDDWFNYLIKFNVWRMLKHEGYMAKHHPVLERFRRHFPEKYFNDDKRHFLSNFNENFLNWEDILNRRSAPSPPKTVDDWLLNHPIQFLDSQI